MNLEVNMNAILNQASGSWKIVKLTEDSPKIRKSILDYLIGTFTLQTLQNKDSAYRIPIDGIEIYFYELGEFIMDFDPETVKNDHALQELVSFLRKIGEEFSVTMELFDETDHKSPILRL